LVGRRQCGWRAFAYPPTGLGPGAGVVEGRATLKPATPSPVSTPGWVSLANV
jgi:hypothetical protein